MSDSTDELSSESWIGRLLGTMTIAKSRSTASEIPQPASDAPRVSSTNVLLDEDDSDEEPSWMYLQDSI
jgi:hypothetical protein